MNDDMDSRWLKLLAVGLSAVLLQGNCNGASLIIHVNLGSVNPPAAVIHCGDTVVWQVVNSTRYYVESYGGEWRSPVLSGSGARYAFTFLQPGDYTYRTLVDQPPMGFSYSAAGRIIVLEPTNPPPKVMISTPIPEFYYVAPGGFTAHIIVNSNRPIECVELFAGTNLVGTATNSPYEIPVYPTPAGRYTLTAVMTDDAAAKATSAPVKVDVIGDNVRGLLFAPKKLATGQLRFHYAVDVPRWHLQSSDDLVNWQSRDLIFFFGTWVDESASEAAFRFYRLRKEAGFTR